MKCTKSYKSDIPIFTKYSKLKFPNKSNIKVNLKREHIASNNKADTNHVILSICTNFNEKSVFHVFPLVFES